MRTAARFHLARLGRVTGAAVGAVLMVALAPSPAHAHGDDRLVDEEMTLAPGSSASFDGELHYHRLVGEVMADGPVRVRLVEVHSGDDVVVLGPGMELAANELVRCCDQPWTLHTLVIENVGTNPVSVTARVSLVHDDLAVMVDGAESGTRAALVILGLAWWALVWRAFTRRSDTIRLRLPLVGLAVLSGVTLGVGAIAAARYGVGGASSVVAGHAMLPLVPPNPIVSQASLLILVSIVGWTLTGWWWIRTRRDVHQVAWVALGVALAGSAAVVAIAILAAHGGPMVQSAWLAVSVTPIVAVLVAHLRSPDSVPWIA